MTGQSRPIRLRTSRDHYRDWAIIFSAPVGMVLMGADALDGGGLFEWFWLAAVGAVWLWAIGTVRSGVFVDDQGAVLRSEVGVSRRVWWVDVERVISREEEDGRRSIHFLLIDGTEVATGIRQEEGSRTSNWWNGSRGRGSGDYAVALKIIRKAHRSGTPPPIPRQRNTGRRSRRTR